jgi:hypothetical protein
MTEFGAVSGFLLGKRLVNNSSVLLGAELGVIQGQGNLRVMRTGWAPTWC